MVTIIEYVLFVNKTFFSLTLLVSSFFSL